MNRYLSFMQSLATPAMVWLSFGVFLTIYGLLNFTTLPFSIPSLMAASGGKTILNVLPYYNAESAYEHIAAYSQEAVTIYYRILGIDLLALIPAYLLFLTAGLLHGSRLVLRSYPRVYSVLALMPLTAAFLNLIEDGLVVFLLESYPSRHDTVATLCGMITTTKSSLMMASLLLLVGFYFVVGLSRTLYLFGLRKCHA